MITQHTWHFWFEKLKEQIVVLNIKSQKESRDRFLVLDIVLSYVFLHLFLEATIIRITQELIRRTDYAKLRDYRKRKMYLKERVDFLFSTFCSELPHKKLVKLKEIIHPLIKIRNSIIHLDDISWKTNFPDDGPLLETPIKNTKHLTIKNLKEQYDSTRDFFGNLKIILNQAFDNQSIDIEHIKDKHKEIKKENMIDYVYKNTVFTMPDFDSLVRENDKVSK